MQPAPIPLLVVLCFVLSSINSVASGRKSLNQAICVRPRLRRPMLWSRPDRYGEDEPDFEAI